MCENWYQSNRKDKLSFGKFTFAVLKGYHRERSMNVIKVSVQLTTHHYVELVTLYSVWTPTLHLHFVHA
jgi:hypothetical protein